MSRETWIGDLYTSEFGWTHLEQLVSISGRLPGSDAEKKAAEVTAEAFQQAGIDNVWENRYEITGWERGESSLRAIDSNAGYQCLALPRSPPSTVTGPLVDLDYGLPCDFESNNIEDCVVLIKAGIPNDYERYVHRVEKYRYAVEHGASGFLFTNTLDGNLPMTGSLDSPTQAIGEIPGLALSKEVGRELVRRHDGELVELSVDATIKPTTSHNVHARIGPGTSQRILLTSHIDAHDLADGAVDNGTGTAVVVEVMQALVRSDHNLEVDVEAVGFGSEEINLVGSEHAANQMSPDNIRAIVNLDGVAQGRDLEAYHHEIEPIRSAIEAVETELDRPFQTYNEAVPFSDHWPFLKRGVPVCFLTSSDGDALRGWGHTHGDTLDKVDKRDLREHAILVTALIRSLAQSSEQIPKLSSSEVADKLRRESQLQGLQVMGWWTDDQKPSNCDG